ncbi:uncharacterized protein BDR25DRAFT_320282 [Lindgomyces ingoldianus]|uniref:Uncharacterized protein n=1 Tax=Lindgomyces ingoldianus TaxID=673940 RepID=A0ACB6Q861_9PLEO|nr:uncharacterized protein BDR25DRAFT_320282 [Lindgomyces ingoldianus]KAF2463098.1 hypothetical protein BDR25DRAFT_320282 [Lindgomyces ingoldianus]
MTIDGEYYPVGVIVGTPNRAMGRNEEHCEDVSTFRPEKWIVSDDLDSPNVTPRAMLASSSRGSLPSLMKWGIVLGRSPHCSSCPWLLQENCGAWVYDWLLARMSERAILG